MAARGSLSDGDVRSGLLGDVCGGDLCFDGERELGEAVVAVIRRNCRSASSIPAAVQRRDISPDCQRLTFR
jgi:hypothetical protein